MATGDVQQDLGGYIGVQPLAAASLPASGVTAGTYGDATHVGQFTVTAKGVISAASNVVISGSSAAGLVQLFDSTLGSAASSIDTGANGVAAGHGALIIEIVARAAAAVINGDMYLRFNNDSGGNYDWAWVRNAGGTVGAVDGHADTGADVAQMTGASATASYAAPCTVTIPAYDQTTFYKTGTALGGSSQDGTSAVRIIFSSFTWRNTAAISRVALFNPSGNLVTGSRMTIYGTS